MANKINTVFDNLINSMSSGFDKNVEDHQKIFNSYTLQNDSVLLKTKNKEEAETFIKQQSQNKYLANQWVKGATNLRQRTGAVENARTLMFRDADIMDGFPEIGAALDLYAEECCTLNLKGKMLNIYSNSKRVKTILEDLFINRLEIHTNLPMWVRMVCKYGNNYLQLNVFDKKGVIGSRQLPVYEMQRFDGGEVNPYSAILNSKDGKVKDTEFVWLGQNEGAPYKNFQIAHFRLLSDSTFLPYGTSILHKARRHFRILSMMEDAMLIYRLERSIERRVYKINVGDIDDKDIQAYVQGIANTFKRTPIIDPETGQLDVRRNMMSIADDIFIPVRTDNATTPIDTLQAASNLDKIEDLTYIQNKVLTALRVPKEFLNFSENGAGGGKNLALLDIRFNRVVNRIQQSIIMELNKIAQIHLYLLGFADEINNFKITMNNPSTQSEMLKLEELSKKISLVRDACQKTDGGIQIMSLTRAQKEILCWSDEEISQNMLEIRMENALSAELAKTEQIIKRTGFFDKVDKLYGDVNAEYEGAGEQPSGGSGSMGGSSGFDSGFSGGDFDLTSDIETPEQVGGEEPIKEPEVNIEPEKMESISNKTDKLLLELKKKNESIMKERQDIYFKSYIKHINENADKFTEDTETPIQMIDDTFIINEEINSMIKSLSKKGKTSENKIK